MSGSRVLVVDDEPQILRALETSLQGAGYTVVSAATAAEALAAAAMRPPDAVILDVMLPDLDGFEACRRIRVVSNVPVLMLTAKGRDTDVAQGLGCGADAYVTKPFATRELAARVREMLAR